MFVLLGSICAIALFLELCATVRDYEVRRIECATKEGSGKCLPLKN